jgi:LEA14-like dessication related protein
MPRRYVGDFVNDAMRRLAVVSCCALLAGACTGVRTGLEAPQVTLETVRVVKIAEGKAEVSLNLKLTNRSDVELAIDAVEFDVALDGRSTVNGRSVHVDPLPAGGEAKVELSGRVDLAAVATALMSVGSQLPVAYSLSGTIRLKNGAALPFSRKGEIPVTRFDRALGSRP